MLDTGEHATLEDLARAKGGNVTYVSRILQLTRLAPEIVEAIDPRPPFGKVRTSGSLPRLPIRSTRLRV